MGFSMPWLKRFSLAVCLLWLAFPIAGTMAADGIQIHSAELRQVDDEYRLYAQIDVTLTSLLADAVNRGVSLYFITDFEFLQPRWYWFPEELAHVSRVTRLSYNTLLRQYVVSGVDVRTRNVDRLSDALTILGRIDGWPVIPRDRLSKTQNYRAVLTMRLDTSQLPKPLQINAIATGRWDLEATPLVWMMTP